MLPSELGDDHTKMWISGTICTPVPDSRLTVNLVANGPDVTTDGAGVDTTHTAVNQFVAAMLLFPEVQRRGQAEIDAVIGSDHLPTFEE